MAKKSQTSGERKLGQISRALGYGASQKASHGRPRWMIGNIAPIISANTVITSAQRVTGRRQRGVDQPQDRRDQRAGVADADPEHEVGEVEAPEDRPVDAGHADAEVHLVEPRRRAAQHDGAEHQRRAVEPHRGVEQRPDQVVGERVIARPVHAIPAG